jgi:signal peptidase II
LTRFLLFWGFSLGGCALDLLTKHWIFQWRGLPRANNEWWIWEPFVGIETAVNTGALFGLGGGHGRIFAILSIVAALGIIFWLFYLGAARDRWLTLALGCVMGGILGNLYDRLGFWTDANMPLAWQSAVRDWILFRYREYTWPNFNIADSLLVCGAIMLVWHAFFEPQGGAARENP